MIVKLSLILFSFIAYLPASIIQVDTLAEIKQQLPALDQHTLVLLDVDYTLIIADDAILRPCGQKLVKPFISSDLIHSQLLLQAKTSLVDPNFKALVQELQEKHVPAIALTAITTGEVGAISSLADWRINELKAHGLDFSCAFTHTVVELPKQADKAFAPLFKSGVLFASKHPKGMVLKAFFDAIRWHPKSIVFIDDRREYLESVEQVASKMGIDYIGFHYTQAEKLPCTLNEELAKLQFRKLEETGTWLSDKEARTYIDQL